MHSRQNDGILSLNAKNRSEKAANLGMVPT